MTSLPQPRHLQTFPNSNSITLDLPPPEAEDVSALNPRLVASDTIRPGQLLPTPAPFKDMFPIHPNFEASCNPWLVPFYLQSNASRSVTRSFLGPRIPSPKSAAPTLHPLSVVNAPPFLPQGQKPVHIRMIRLTCGASFSSQMCSFIS